MYVFNLDAQTNKVVYFFPLKRQFSNQTKLNFFNQIFLTLDVSEIHQASMKCSFDSHSNFVKKQTPIFNSIKV